MKIYFSILFTLLLISGYAPIKSEYLTFDQIKEDLEILDSVLQNQSSYQGLNGYHYQEDFNHFLKNAEGNHITKSDFGIFLTKTIGRMGDRHAYIKGYDLPESLYFPISFAPFHNNILVLDYIREQRAYQYWKKDFPYLKSIDGIPIEQIISKVLPRDALAPEASYFTRAVRELRDIETVFSLMGRDLPNPLSIALTNDQGGDTTVSIDLVPEDQKGMMWDERFKNKYFFFDYDDEQRNNKAILSQFFSMKALVGYIQITSMVGRDGNPVFFDLLNTFMTQAKQSAAIIIDVRDNGGGNRDLIQELAGYFVHPDSIYVGNVTKQRGMLPLSKALQEELSSRYLLSANQLKAKEKRAAEAFMTSFTPMYDLNDKTFSEYYYYVLNGKKLSKSKYYYDKPIYILANERTFSAASVLVSVFKGLPNITVVGVNTDGSSGNSQRFELPNSGLRGKISTMVSFQKDGQILDGIGTAPDIVFERDIPQILFRSDYQLERLLELIRNNTKANR